jgi:hypothetical protein
MRTLCKWSRANELSNVMIQKTKTTPQQNKEH